MLTLLGKEKKERERLIERSRVISSSEVEMQSELDNAVGKRCLTDRPEARTAQARTGIRGIVARKWIGVGLSELGMVRKIKEITREDETSLLSEWNLEIFLQGEVEVVDAGVAHIGKETRARAERFR